MKATIVTLFAALLIAPGLMAVPAQAKSVKWYCVASDPANPQNLTCYPSTSRP